MLKEDLQDSAFERAIKQLDLPGILALQCALSQQALHLALTPKVPVIEDKIIKPNNKLVI